MPGVVRAVVAAFCPFCTLILTIIYVSVIVQHIDIYQYEVVYE